MLQPIPDGHRVVSEVGPYGVLYDYRSYVVVNTYAEGMPAIASFGTKAELIEWLSSVKPHEWRTSVWNVIDFAVYGRGA